jgi:hypothetical protein
MRQHGAAAEAPAAGAWKPLCKIDPTRAPHGCRGRALSHRRSNAGQTPRPRLSTIGSAEPPCPSGSGSHGQFGAERG